MAYTKPDQTPFAANLTDHEFVVTLDTGDNIAVRCDATVQANSGNPVVQVFARVVDGTGADRIDSVGQSINSGFSHTSNTGEIATLGGVAVLQKLCVMAVLGEPTSPMWGDPLHATMLQNASIRTNLASAAHAGPVTNLATII